jgi:hypothetical protein
MGASSGHDAGETLATGGTDSDYGSQSGSDQGWQSTTDQST